MTERQFTESEMQEIADKVGISRSDFLKKWVPDELLFGYAFSRIHVDEDGSLRVERISPDQIILESKSDAHS